MAYPAAAHAFTRDDIAQAAEANKQRARDQAQRSIGDTLLGYHKILSLGNPANSNSSAMNVAQTRTSVPSRPKSNSVAAQKLPQNVVELVSLNKKILGIEQKLLSTNKQIVGTLIDIRTDNRHLMNAHREMVAGAGMAKRAKQEISSQYNGPSGNNSPNQDPGADMIGKYLIAAFASYKAGQGIGNIINQQRDFSNQGIGLKEQFLALKGLITGDKSDLIKDMQEKKDAKDAAAKAAAGTIDKGVSGEKPDPKATPGSESFLKSSITSGLTSALTGFILGGPLGALAGGIVGAVGYIATTTVSQSFNSVKQTLVDTFGWLTGKDSVLAKTKTNLDNGINKLTQPTSLYGPAGGPIGGGGLMGSGSTPTAEGTGGNLPAPLPGPYPGGGPGFVSQHKPGEGTQETPPNPLEGYDTLGHTQAGAPMENGVQAPTSVGDVGGLARASLAKTTVTGPGRFTSASTAKAGSLSANQQEAYAAARNEGLSDPAARALVANMSGESLHDPSNNTGDYGQAQGIVQWHPDRAEAIKAQFGKYPKDMTVAEQTKAAVWEMKTNKAYAQTWTDLNNPQMSSEDMVSTLVNNYERPADKAGAIANRVTKLQKFKPEFKEAPIDSQGGSTITSTNPALKPGVGEVSTSLAKPTEGESVPGVSVAPTMGAPSHNAMYKSALDYSKQVAGRDPRIDPSYQSGPHTLNGACVRGTMGVLSALTGDKVFTKAAGGNADSYSLGNNFLERTGKMTNAGAVSDDYLKDPKQWRIGDTISSVGGHASGQGHIQTFDGKNWVSDGIQEQGPLSGYSGMMLHRMNAAGIHSISPDYIKENDPWGATQKYLEQTTPPPSGPSPATMPNALKSSGPFGDMSDVTNSDLGSKTESLTSAADKTKSVNIAKPDTSVPIVNADGTISDPSTGTATGVSATNPAATAGITDATATKPGATSTMADAPKEKAPTITPQPSAPTNTPQRAKDPNATSQSINSIQIKENTGTFIFGQYV